MDIQKTHRLTPLEIENTDQPDILGISNSHVDHLSKLEFTKGFYTIRDPRDVVVSSYYSHLHSHKTSTWTELAEHREQIKKWSKEDGILFEIESCRKEHFTPQIKATLKELCGDLLIELGYEQTMNW